jgi:hypothetical protein
MNHFFKITSLASLCFVLNSLSAQNKTTTRIIEIQNGDTVRNETIIRDGDPDHDPQGSDNEQGQGSNNNFKFEEKDFEKNLDEAMRKMERGLKDLENFSMNLDMTPFENGLDKFMNGIEKLSDVRIDTKTRKRWGKKQTEIIIRGPKGNNQIIILDKKGNVKTRKEFDKKQAKKYEQQQKLKAENKALYEKEKALKKQNEAIKKQEAEVERQKEMNNTVPASPKFMMSTDDNKIYNFMIETGSDKEVEIEITGKNDKVLLKEIEPRGRKFEKEIDLGKFGPGTYTIKLTQSEKEISKHVIVIGE